MAEKPDLTAKKSRTFSKRLTAWSVLSTQMITAAAIGLNPGGAADILSVSLPSQIALLGLYMGTGHLDLRSWLNSGLLDIKKK